VDSDSHGAEVVVDGSEEVQFILDSFAGNTQVPYSLVIVEDANARCWRGRSTARTPWLWMSHMPFSYFIRGGKTESQGKESLAPKEIDGSF